MAMLSERERNELYSLKGDEERATKEDWRQRVEAFCAQERHKNLPWTQVIQNFKLIEEGSPAWQHFLMVVGSKTTFPEFFVEMILPMGTEKATVPTHFRTLGVNWCQKQVASSHISNARTYALDLVTPLKGKEWDWPATVRDIFAKSPSLQKDVVETVLNEVQQTIVNDCIRSMITSEKWVEFVLAGVIKDPNSASETKLLATLANAKAWGDKRQAVFHARVKAKGNQKEEQNDVDIKMGDVALSKALKPHSGKSKKHPTNTQNPSKKQKVMDVKPKAIKCYYCGVLGHKSSECPDAEKFLALRAATAAQSQEKQQSQSISNRSAPAPGRGGHTGNTPRGGGAVRGRGF